MFLTSVKVRQVLVVVSGKFFKLFEHGPMGEFGAFVQSGFESLAVGFSSRQVSCALTGKHTFDPHGQYPFGNDAVAYE